MKDLILKETETTPSVSLKAKENCFEFAGVSFAEDAIKFYGPIFDWIEEYASYSESSKPKKITCNFKFEYLNSASYIVVRDVAERFLDITEKTNAQLEINWYYLQEDEDMLNMAKEFEYILDTEINYLVLSAN